MRVEPRFFVAGIVQDAYVVLRLHVVGQQRLGRKFAHIAAIALVGIAEKVPAAVEKTDAVFAEDIQKVLVLKAEAADEDREAAANAAMKEFSLEVTQFAKDDVKIKITTSIPESGWSYTKDALVENDDPGAFGAGAIRFKVRENLEMLDTNKDSFKNLQEIEDRVIGGISFKGRTYEYIGYDWIEYVAQIDETRALSIGLTDLDCLPGTMPDIILSNMKFQ